MPTRTALTVQSASRTGTVQAAEQNSDVTNGNSVPNTGRTIVVAHNTNATTTARVLTINFGHTVDGQVIDPIDISIAAGASVICGKYRVDVYGRTLTINADNAELKFRVYEP